MSEKENKFSAELDALVKEGDQLVYALQYHAIPEEFEASTVKAFGKEKSDEFLKKLPDFGDTYQSWYSKAQAVVKQVIPDRYSDFVSHYEYQKPRKEISFQNYMIRDALQGLQIIRGGEVRVNPNAAVPELSQQVNILRAAKAALSSRLFELRSILQADLFDSEIDAAKALAKAGYLRAAGAICGVVIEKHLTEVCISHGVLPKKKNPGISDLNQALRDNDTITVPQWRFIQHLADIRNICDHAKGREPTKEEIEALTDGASRTLKTIF